MLGINSARRMVVTLNAIWRASSSALQRMRARAARIWALVSGGGWGSGSLGHVRRQRRRRVGFQGLGCRHSAMVLGTIVLLIYFAGLVIDRSRKEQQTVP